MTCGQRLFFIMEIIHDLDRFAPPSQGSAVTIGNFDGVHLAHQALLRRTAQRARELGSRAAAVTFEPHPIQVLAPDRAPRILTSLPTRARRMEQLGIDLLIVLPFTRELAHLSPLDFVEQILVARLRANFLCVGPNFRFGYRQAGDVSLLNRLSREGKFSLEILPIIEIRGQAVSSTCIRQLLSEGRVHMAGRLLGRPFSNSGPIVSGRGIGRRHAVPTLNLNPNETQWPMVGVYVTRTRLGDEWRDSVTNVGYSPTFGNHRLTIETHLLNFEGDVQETQMEIEYLHRLRDEIKFQNPAMLRLQIQEDVRRSLKFFRLLDYFRQPEGRRSPRYAPNQA